MIINIYTIGKKQKLVENMLIRSKYDSSFYFRKMPYLSGKRCRDILNGKKSGLFVLEDAQTGYSGLQELFASGTILNF